MTIGPTRRHSGLNRHRGECSICIQSTTEAYRLVGTWRQRGFLDVELQVKALGVVPTAIVGSFIERQR